MQERKRYEILPGLPPYGPMAINIPPDEWYASEGFVVRFFKSDGSSWVANLRTGIGISEIYDYPERNKIIILAEGAAYIINPNDENVVNTFGGSIDKIIQSDTGYLICSTGVYIIILNTNNLQLWQSERISWDGIKDMKLEGNIITGLSYDPTNSLQVWAPFTLNMESKETTGGSYRNMLDLNPHLKGKLLS